MPRPSSGPRRHLGDGRARCGYTAAPSPRNASRRTLARKNAVLVARQRSRSDRTHCPPRPWAALRRRLTSPPRGPAALRTRLRRLLDIGACPSHIAFTRRGRPCADACAISPAARGCSKQAVVCGRIGGRASWLSTNHWIPIDLPVCERAGIDQAVAPHARYTITSRGDADKTWLMWIWPQPFLLR